MGYHTYNLAKFDLYAVGNHKCYIYLFTQHDCDIRSFSENIGQGAVAITSGIQNGDWKFADILPSSYNMQALFYATVLVICPERSSAESFLSAYKGSTVLGMLSPRRRVRFNELEGICFLCIPKSTDTSNVLKIISEYIRSGKPAGRIKKERLDLLCQDLRLMTGFKAHNHGNAIFLETITLRESAPVASEHEEIYKILNKIHDDIVSVNRSRETDDLLKNLKALRRDLAKQRPDVGGLKVELSAGFDAFGSGAKVIYESKKLSIEPLEQLRKLLGTRVPQA
jgi:hypothetical protein